MDILASEEFVYRGRHYRVEVKRHYSGELVWNGFRRGGIFDWEKIESFTRAEEKRFPLIVAERGYLLWKRVSEENKVVV